MQKFSTSISSAALMLALALPSAAHDCGADSTAAAPALACDTVCGTARYAASITMPRGHVSGVCMLHRCGSEVRGCIFNEFGISAMEFVYTEGCRKVRLLGVVKMLDKWYIRRVLRRDLARAVANLLSGRFGYTNVRRSITYKFTPIDSNATE